MPYKLAAIDLDDTMIDNSHNFTPRTYEAVKRSVEKGFYIVLASGRTFRGLKKYYDMLAIRAPLITCGGSIVTDADGKVLYSSVVSHDQAKRVLEYAEEKGVHAQVYFGDDFVFRKRTEYAKIYEGFYGFPGVEMPDLMSRDLTTPKVLFIAEPEKIQVLLKDAAGRFPELAVATSKPFYLEFNNPLASKGKALEFLTDYLSLKREEVIAIGDSGIDLSMIEYAGLGVAMENATPEVKEKADYITFSNEEDGVAHVLEKFMLEENP
jgi:Cof subfamily protein (haloacid dehalogenase superfamily)